MSRYTVVWVQSAEDELVDIWTEADDRKTVTEAAVAVDHLLQSNADSTGEELAEGLRVLNEPPLRVIFSVNADDRTVEVLRVRRL